MIGTLVTIVRLVVIMIPIIIRLLIVIVFHNNH
jgi:hypothetical protein